MEIQEMIDVLTAYRDGKAIQFRNKKPKWIDPHPDVRVYEWKDAEPPYWNFYSFDYRIKE